MPTTRSSTKQTNLEDFADSKTTISSSTTEKAIEKTKQPLKRKSPEPLAKETNTTAKRRRTVKTADEDKPDTVQDKQKSANTSPKKAASSNDEANPSVTSDHGNSSIIINRAPVLHLYSACVTHLLYPDLAWDGCLSAGSAISALCAMAKGRSIGVVSEPEEKSVDEKKASEKMKKGLEEIDVMQFKLRTNKDGFVVLGKDTKKGDEAGLKRKFGGDDQYEGVKKSFDEALSTWNGEEQELSSKAFGFYERFRPNIAKGGPGWGRKGELSFDIIKEAITKP